MKNKRSASAIDKDFRYQVEVLGHFDFNNEWSGWKLRGPYLVSPSGDRILPQRLLGILLTESLRKRGQPKRISKPADGPLPTVVAMVRRHAG